MSETAGNVLERSPDQVAAELLPRLRSDRVTYFPVRHHSPACAAHIEKWILKHRPTAVLVEGPGSFTSKIEQLVDERCKSPVALFTNFIDKKDRLSSLFKSEEGSDENEKTEEKQYPEEPDKKPEYHLDLGPPRYAAYYPFCDYSPELVALRIGKQVDARLRFIDLEYGEMVLHQFQVLKNRNKDTVRIDSLAEDSHLKHSLYMNALAKQMGCRDFDELWDHLFEACSENISTEAFMDRLATYCAMARLGYKDEDLINDGTVAREACMAAAIAEELAKSDNEKILVVTGGFHTVALPQLVAEKTKRPPEIKFSDDEVGAWLMRYSFDRLDALSGYQSGMPSPAFYDRLWHSEREEDGTREARFERVSADFMLEISRLTREKKLSNLITTPDAIAALQMTKQLAALRGHQWPMREDVLDGIRSCFIKGELGVEGQALMHLVRQILAGNRVGHIPPGSDQPPIIADFNKEVKRFRLQIDRVEKKEHSLDLYRNATHRAMSRFFHRLSLLGVHFANYIDGPDFVHGHRLDLIIEHWESVWSPNVESALIEASIYGTTIEEAAGNKLKLQIAGLEEESHGRSSAAAVTLLVRACRLGLHAQSTALVPLIDVHIAEDPMVSSAVSALSQLDLLQRAREPLEAFDLTAVPRLMTAAYQRACRLLHDVAHCPNEMVEDNMRAMQTLREVLASFQDEVDEEQKLDEELFFDGMRSIINYPPDQAQSTLIGAAAGILYGEGKMDEGELISVVCGFLGGTFGDPRKSAGILRGLLTTACEIAWQVTEVIQALDSQFQSWDEKTFMELLPELRLAFSLLTPRDIARVAEKVAGLHEGESLGELVHMDIGETDVQLGLMINDRVRQSLQADGFLPKDEVSS